MANKVFDSDRLTEYLANIDRAKETRRARGRDLMNRIEWTLSRIDELGTQIDKHMATVNQLRGRRHNVISVSWAVDKRRLDRSYNQPMGPIWSQVLHGADGRRHLKRIRKVTLETIRNAYQGRDAGIIKRQYVAIKALADERNRLLAAIDRVVKALQYVYQQPELPARTET